MTVAAAVAAADVGPTNATAVTVRAALTAVPRSATVGLVPQLTCAFQPAAATIGMARFTMNCRLVSLVPEKQPG